MSLIPPANACHHIHVITDASPAYSSLNMQGAVHTVTTQANLLTGLIDQATLSHCGVLNKDNCSHKSISKSAVESTLPQRTSEAVATPAVCNHVGCCSSSPCQAPAPAMKEIHMYSHVASLKSTPNLPFTQKLATLHRLPVPCPSGCTPLPSNHPCTNTVTSLVDRAPNLCRRCTCRCCSCSSLCSC